MVIMYAQQIQFNYVRKIFITNIFIKTTMLQTYNIGYIFTGHPIHFRARVELGNVNAYRELTHTPG